MGYYIQTPQDVLKAEYLINHENAVRITEQEARDLVKSGGDEGVVVVVSNAIFEAAAYTFSPEEFSAFTMPDDDRPRKFLKMDRGRIHELTRYKENLSEL
jgi:hypothetical protein